MNLNLKMTRVNFELMVRSKIKPDPDQYYFSHTRILYVTVLVVNLLTIIMTLGLIISTIYLNDNQQ